MTAAAHAQKHATELLLAALVELGGGACEVLRHVERHWASITFSGARHRVTLVFDGIEAVAAGERFIEQLPEHEFDVPGQLVADAGIMAAVHEWLPEPKLTVEAELLLLEDA